MNQVILGAMAVSALGLTTLSATAAKVLNDFPRHELEEYCQKRKNGWLFRQVLEDYRRLCLGAEVLEMFAISMMLFCGALWLLNDSPQPGSLSLSEMQLMPAILLATVVLLFSSSWIPWAVVKYFSAPFIYHTWRLWWFFATLFQPILIGMEFIGEVLQRLSGQISSPEDEEEEIEDEILSMVAAGQTGGFLHSAAREMIEGVIELDELVVETIMTPRSRVVAVEVNASWDEILDVCRDGRHTRLPVYQGTLDNVIGVLHTRDALIEALKPVEQRRPIRWWMRKSLRTPDTRFVNEMLKVFLQPGNTVHLAVVFNEHQTMVGVITIEDILEEIVGDITDETDRGFEPRIHRVSDTVLEVPGRFRVDELVDETDFDIPEDDEYDTVAGWILFSLGEVPKPGQQFQIQGIRCTILRGTPRRIEYVRLEQVEGAAADLTAAVEAVVSEANGVDGADGGSSAPLDQLSPQEHDTR